MRSSGVEWQRRRLTSVLFFCLSLPRHVGALANLKAIFLGDNLIEELPDEFFGLKHLAWVDLSSNKLTRLSPRIGDMQQLRQLDLTGNQLLALPAAMGRLTNLHNLSLTGNRLDPARFNRDFALEALVRFREEAVVWYGAQKNCRAAVDVVTLMALHRRQRGVWWWLPLEIWLEIRRAMWETRFDEDWCYEEEEEEEEAEEDRSMLEWGLQSAAEVRERLGSERSLTWSDAASMKEMH